MKLENESPTDKQICNNNLMDHSYDSMGANGKDSGNSDGNNSDSKISDEAIFVNHKINSLGNSKDDPQKMEKEQTQNSEFPNLISEEEKKKLFYKKVDEILNMNNSNDDEWIQSEDEKASSNSMIIEKDEYVKKIKSKDVEGCYGKKIKAKYRDRKSVV